MQNKNILQRVSPLFFIVVSVLLFSSCYDVNSPFTIRDSDFSKWSSNSVVEGLYYLPNDPANMTPAQRQYFIDMPWVAPSLVSDSFTDIYIESINKLFTTYKYYFQTEQFVKSYVQTAVANKEVSGFFDGTYNKEIYYLYKGEGLNHDIYKNNLSDAHHVNPLEVVMLLRNLEHEPTITRNKDYINSGCSAGVAFGVVPSRKGFFKPTFPFNGNEWHYRNDGNFPGPSGTMIPWYNHGASKKEHTLSGVDGTSVTSMTSLIHEMLHNMGYGHGATTWSANEGLAVNELLIVDVPYSSGYGEMDRAFPEEGYAKGTTLNLVRQRYDEYILPHIYDIANQAEITDRKDSNPGAMGVPGSACGILDPDPNITFSISPDGAVLQNPIPTDFSVVNDAIAVHTHTFEIDPETGETVASCGGLI